MYFGEIFRSFRDYFPNMFVCVDISRRYENPYGLDLKAILRKCLLPMARRTAAGASYPSGIAIPSAAFLWHLWRLKPDAIIVIEFTPVAILGAIAAKVFGRAKLVLLVESDPASRGGSTNPLVLAVKRWAVRRADVIQTNNDAGANYLTGLLRAPPGKVRIAPYLTSRPPGPSLPPERSEAGQPVRMLFANSLNERKGLRHVLIALSLLPARIRAGVILTVVGDGPDREALQRQAGELGLSDIVNFVGARPYREIGQFFAEADVLVAPSVADYRSLASFEGLNYGLALLVSDKDGAACETVMAGQTGFVFSPEDHNRIAELIELFAVDRKLLETCRKNALALGISRYSVDSAAHNIAVSLEQALA